MSEALREGLEQAARQLRGAASVAVMTGAGVSAESGVPTFRDAGGLWEGHRVQDVATPKGFIRDPRLVWRFYNERRRNLLDRRPNPAHLALAQLEAWIRDFTLITQNVDGLHRQAGSRNLHEVHGNIWINQCSGCAQQEWIDGPWPATADASSITFPECPTCQACGFNLRPGVVWFGELLPEMPMLQAERAVNRCDVMLVVGTSSLVYPAAGLAHLAMARGAFLIEVNLQRTPLSPSADVVLTGKAGCILPELLDLLRPGFQDGVEKP